MTRAFSCDILLRRCAKIATCFDGNLLGTAYLQEKEVKRKSSMETPKRTLTFPFLMGLCVIYTKNQVFFSKLYFLPPKKRVYVVTRA